MAFALGRRSDGSYDHHSGVDQIVQYAKALEPTVPPPVLVDASGLSHDNRLSTATLLAVLTRMAADERIRPEFESSLSVLGKSGTLKGKHKGLHHIFVRGKTGTLTGVSSLAGYILNKRGEKIAFALIQNTVPSPQRASQIERGVLVELYEQ